jgi:molecular chaperone GrpE
MSHRTAGDEARPSEDRVDTAALQAENESLRDRMLRALAEVENTQRRAERAQRDAHQFAISDFARELLPVIDNLQRTIAAAERRAPEAAEDAALIEGVRAIQQLLLHIFRQFGIDRVDAQGRPFDPSLHEAMMEEVGGEPPGTVVRVLEDGYTLNDRLLRPARVAVAPQRGAESTSAETGENRAEPGSSPSAKES